MSVIQRYLIGIGIVLVVLYGCMLYGEHRVQTEWDKHEAVEAAADKAQVVLNEETNALVRKSHEEDIKFAESKAGRTAVADWVSKHGLLSGSAPVRTPAGIQANGDKVNDDSSVEHGVGGVAQGGTEEAVTSFATDCAKDALRLEDEWQAWAIRLNLKVEE
jgi:hypothetical protein